MVTAALRDFFARHSIEPCPLLAAVSGGIDSTALLVALADLRTDGFSITAAHINHHLRGDESEEDQQFVRALCTELEIPLHVADGTLASDRIRAGGTEAAAREIRYRRLTEIRAMTGTSWIATAHQKNDQAETILLRLLTGSGIRGLRGIHEVRFDGVVRPLLEVTREEIDLFLAGRGITARQDSSNLDPRFLRNRIREIVRELQAVGNLAGIAAQAASIWPVLETAIDAEEERCVRMESEATKFLEWPDDVWLRQALLHRHIRRLDPQSRDVSARDLERIAGHIDGIQRIGVTKSLELVRKGEVLILRRPPAATAGFEVALSEAVPAFVPALGMTVHVQRRTRNTEHGTEDAGRLPFHALPSAFRQLFELPADARPEFTVRNRRRGDRFQPLGLPSPKKLKDFLIDRKIDAETRDRLVLLVWNGEIVWVAGVEVSERFKVSSAPRDDVVIFEVWLEG